MRAAVILLAMFLFVETVPARVRRPMRFSATATTLTGVTAKGTFTREGTVAADPAILPLGSRIRVSGAGAYSGVYRVTDTGSGIKGHEIDIYMRSPHEAHRFGRKTVTVRVLSRGNNQRSR